MKLEEDISKLKEMVASLSAMETALLRFIHKEITTAEEVFRVYRSEREKLGFPLSDSDYMRLLHKAEQADAEDLSF